jgi:glycogen operon protein
MSWSAVDEELLAFTTALWCVSQAHPVLRQFLHSRERMIDGVEDLFWWREDGADAGL